MTQPYHALAARQRPATIAGSGPGLRHYGVLLFAALGLTLGAHGQQRPAPAFFRVDAAARAAAIASPLVTDLTRASALTLDEPGLRAALATAPPEAQAGAAPLVLALPLPDGTSGRFALREAPLMEAPLAARFPQIKTYAGVGLDDATASVRLALTPTGCHAQVLSRAGQAFLLEPVGPTDTRHYLSYAPQAARRPAGPAPACGSRASAAEQRASAARVAAWRGAGGPARATSTGAQLRTYRLALTCTPEYALTKGNTVAGVLAAEVATLNRVVGIMERELTVRLVLVANNDQLIFLSGTGPQPSPTLTDSDVIALMDENQQNVDRIIGDANYDLGQVVYNRPGGGGVSFIGALGVAGIKAKGVSNDDGDDVEVLCHELGHQLGADHTFNAVGSAGSTAWEPGAGTTIMSYSGRLSPANNIQYQAEMMYHTGSYEQMQARMSVRNCGTLTATGNAAPVVTVPASGKTLPLNTPFQLTATATDADNDALTYSWEEFDLGPAGDLAMPQVTGQTPPLFRVWLPAYSATRSFPRLAELVNNTAPLGERLPTVARTLSFRCTARDLHSGPVGPVGGVGQSALVNLSVSAAAGPFLVTAPNTAVSWTGGSTQTVTWAVANTTAAPVSCALVNLRLSLDGGLTYPLLLASGVANSGSATITVPNVASTTARVMVAAADNYFFDISNADFTLSPGPGPAISSFTPASGPAGTVVTLTGINLTGATAVAFNGTAASAFTVVSATSLRATVAAGTTSGLITVSTPLGRGVSATPFLVGSLPTIASFTPASGPVSTTVLVSGTNLLGTTQVTLNGADVPTFFVNSATRLTLLVPGNASTGRLVVTTPLGTATSATDFTVPLLPVIDSFTPNGGPIGTVVTLTGANLTGATRVTLNGVSVPGFTVNSAIRITATVPVGATTGLLAVFTPLGVGVTANDFTVIPTPVLATLSSSAGVVTTVLRVTGIALSGATAVTFTNGGGTATPAAAGFVVGGSTGITDVRVPAGLAAGAYTLTVTTPGGTSNGLPFTVLPHTAGPAPVISSFTPASGAMGARLTLTGTGLSATTQVIFSGSSANVVNNGFAANAAGTQLTGIIVPAGAATGPLRVATPNGTSPASSLPFTVCPLPVALARNVTVTLNANGTATLAATAVNNGSTASCGPAPAAFLSVSPNTFTTADIRPPAVASALRFTGSGQYVNVDYGTTVPVGNSNYTIEAWVKPTAMGGYGIIGWGSPGAPNLVNALRLTATGLLNYWWANDLEVRTASLVGAWHHVAATYDGTTRTIYLDGVAVGSDTPRGHNVPNVGNLRIGSTNFGEYFPGSIDEVRVWNVARTAAQLHATKGVGLPGGTAGLVAYYRFSEGNGLTAADGTGTAANLGTLTGGPTWSTDAPPVVNGIPVTLTLTDADGNTSTAPAVVTVVVATATATKAPNADWAPAVYPNPAHAAFAVRVPAVAGAATVRATLVNALGQTVRQQTAALPAAGTTLAVETGGLAAGVYTLRLQAGPVTVAKPVVLQ